MKSNPTEQETEDYEKIETNLNVLGYSEGSAKIIGQAKNVDDVLVILRTIISVTEAEKELDDFWTNVKIQVSTILEQLGL
jgi:signal-transduction protein with cAMP-binding, CBS, and nucleotidyltransferase domain